MPQPRILDLSPLPRTETTPLEKTLAGFTQRFRENQAEKKETDALSDIYNKYKSDGRNIEDAIMAIHTRPGISPTTRVNAANQLLQYQKYNSELQLKARETAEKSAKNLKEKEEKQAKTALEKNSSLSLIDNSDLDEEQKNTIKQDIEQGKVSYDAVKQIIKPKKEVKSDFHKGLAKENVKSYTNAVNSVVQTQRNLSDLNRIKELNEKISGPLGYFTALDPFNPDASELTALGFGVIEPIVKIFNPSGPIAQKKLEQLQNRYGISALDTSAKIKGKISALERYANYAQDIAKQRIALFEKYDGNPPLGEIAQLDLKGQSIIDQMSQEDPTKPQIFYSIKNGKPVKAPDLETQEKWIKEGLITDVKPQ